MIQIKHQAEGNTDSRTLHRETSACQGPATGRMRGWERLISQRHENGFTQIKNSLSLSSQQWRTQVYWGWKPEAQIICWLLKWAFFSKCFVQAIGQILVFWIGLCSSKLPAGRSKNWVAFLSVGSERFSKPF